MATTSPTYNGSNVQVFPYPPDWTTQPKVTISYKTDVQRSLDDSEERNIIYPRPKVSMRYTTLGLDTDESTHARTFRYDLSGIPVLLPLFFDYVTIDGSVTAGASVSIPHTTYSNTLFDTHRPYAVVWRNHNYFELVEVTGYAPQQMTVDNIANAYERGDKIFPVAMGKIDVSVSKAITGQVAEHDIVFSEEYFF